MISFTGTRVQDPDSHATIAYRREIDGLRTIAVVPVVLFHAGVSWLPGGFIGVDIFFVISGFLITKILWREASEAGRVSIGSFYLRRVRRIAPALLTVLAASLVVAHLTLLPGQYSAFAKSLLATIGFGSNIWFWSQTGYFAAQAGVEPLLHTWSLAVEEQFYLFVPILIGLLARSRRWLLIVLVAAAVLSFGLSVIGLWRSPSVTFYWLPTRAWELLIGSLLALRLCPAITRPALAQTIAAIGMVLIAGSILMITESVPFPGPAALPACLGTAMIIHATEGRETLVGRCLSSTPMVGIGLISYALYLWHWPVMIFSRVQFGPEPAIWATVSLSFGLAVATLFLIEKPTRKRWATRPLLVVVGLATAGLVVAAIVVIRSAGMPTRLPASAVAIAKAGEDRATLCAGRTEWCDTGPNPDVAVIGDSHAALLGEAYDAAGRSIRLLSSNACAPGWRHSTMPPRDGADCDRRNTAAIGKVLADPAIRDVVLVANWPAYDLGDIETHLHNTVARVRAAGKRAVVVYGLPVAEGNLPADLARAEWKGRTPPQLKRPAPIAIAGAQMLDAGAALCRGATCPTVIDGDVVLSDGNHVTRTVARARLSSVVDAASDERAP